MGEDPTSIDRIITTSRGLDEYRAMFALTDVELRLGVLDCAAGASSFAAEADAGGQRIVACDPFYASAPRSLGEMAMAEAQRGSAYVDANSERYAWSFFSDAGDHQRRREASAQNFAGDVAVHPGRYVVASLPDLPFADASFDLVLCSHLLFTYADHLEVAFHVHAICELCRVSRGEVRLFPLVASAAAADVDLSEIRARLAEHGIATRIVPVEYEFQRGATEMLVARRV